KDVGVLRILGYSPRQVLTSFFIEAVMLSLIGGATGCAVGMLFDGWTASSIVSGSAGGGQSVILKTGVDGKILAEGMAVALFMGCIGGLLPALSAMLLKPLDGVR